MKIKRYMAASMRAALDQVRLEQGPDAVILSSRRTSEGIEVIAAIDYDEALIAGAARQYAMAAAAAPTASPRPAASPNAATEAVASPPPAAKAVTAPAITPGSIKGRVIVRKRSKGSAPRVRAAASRPGSTFSSARRMDRTMRGKAITAVASAAPAVVNASWIPK